MSESTAFSSSYPQARDFDLGDILSITDGALVSPRHMDGIYDILNFMTGDNLFTHQLPRAMRECQGPLLKQHPALDGVGLPDDVEKTQDAIMAWLDELKVVYGEMLPVWPLEGGHEVRDPLEELVEMANGKPIIAVVHD